MEEGERPHPPLVARYLRAPNLPVKEGQSQSSALLCSSGRYYIEHLSGTN